MEVLSASSSLSPAHYPLSNFLTLFSFPSLDDTPVLAVCIALGLGWEGKVRVMSELGVFKWVLFGEIGRQY